MVKKTSNSKIVFFKLLILLMFSLISVNILSASNGPIDLNMKIFESGNKLYVQEFEIYQYNDYYLNNDFNNISYDNVKQYIIMYPTNEFIFTDLNEDNLNLFISKSQIFTLDEYLSFIYFDIDVTKDYSFFMYESRSMSKDLITDKEYIVDDFKSSNKYDLSFCNNDGLCNSCETVFCPLMENMLTCNDCRIDNNINNNNSNIDIDDIEVIDGIKVLKEDNTCIFDEDGFCDLDCKDYDPDCENITIEDNQIKRTNNYNYDEDDSLKKSNKFIYIILFILSIIFFIFSLIIYRRKRGLY